MLGRMSDPSPPVEPLLRVAHLRTWFPRRHGALGRSATWTRAVDDVSFELAPGQTLGLVGESGCGKSTLARTILRLIPATGGEVFFDGRDVLALPARQLRPLRRRMQIVFQDPLGSLNPRLRVETIVGEALHVHGLVRSARQRRERVATLLTQVGLSADARDRFPHEFSGGQRQRIGIARALALEPKLIICDEPVAALDVSVRAQVLNLLSTLQASLGLSYLFIAHDLAVVHHFSDEIAVMFAGRIVEQAPASVLFSDPRHPYTQALLRAIPRLSRSDGDHSRPVAPAPAAPSGCPYQSRCPRVIPRCRDSLPPLVTRAGLPPAHRVACFRAADSSADNGRANTALRPDFPGPNELP